MVYSFLTAALTTTDPLSRQCAWNTVHQPSLPRIRRGLSSVYQRIQHRMLFIKMLVYGLVFLFLQLL